MKNDIVIKILDKSKYREYKKECSYQSKKFYKVKLSEKGINYELCEYSSPKKHSFTMTLFAQWLDNPICYGVYLKNKLIGFGEGSMEKWHNLFRISNIYVEEKYRLNGIGSLLIDILIKKAKEEKARGVILETHSCNYPAINFYRKCGFKVVAINTIEYTNFDIENREVRFDMALLLEG